MRGGQRHREEPAPPTEPSAPLARSSAMRIHAQQVAEHLT